MDMRKWTEKSAQAIGKAQSLATEYGNQEVTGLHLLCALVEKDDGLIVQLLQKMQKDVKGIRVASVNGIEKLPKVRGGERYASQTLATALTVAEKKAEEMGDSYVSVEHLFIGLLQSADKSVKEIFAKFSVEENAFMQPPSGQ